MELNNLKKTELYIYCKIMYIYKNMIIITEFLLISVFSISLVIF